MPSESDIVERLSNDPIDRGDGHKAQYFLRAQANNCRLETAYLTAERMDECADILAAQAATIEALRAENERLHEAVNRISDEQLRWIADSKDVTECRGRIRRALQGGQSND